jgi:signal transduction histidine kinase
MDMKRLAIFLFLLVVVSTCYGQSKTIDSLQQLLKQQTTDSGRIRQLIALAEVYRNIRNDSAIIYYQDALSRSLNFGNKHAEINARHLFAVFLYDVKSDYVTALDLYFKNLQVEEQTDDTSYVVSNERFYDTRNIGFIYERIKDFDKQLEYTLKLRDLLHAGIYKDSLSIIRANNILNNRLGAAYLNLNLPDSAKYYFRKIFNYGIQYHEGTAIALSSEGLGNTFAGENDKDSAVYYYHIAAPAALAVKRADIYNEIILSLGDLYWRNKQTDSAFYYTQHVYDLSKQQKAFDIMSEAGALLAQIYYAKSQPDSAYNYLIQSNQIKDSLFSEDKIAQLQNLTLRASMQKQEEGHAKREAVQEYQATVKIYSLFAGITVLLVASLFLYRNNKQKHIANEKISKAYEELKSTQAQLIQSEKMASLGELTAGIAHEIQNPLNFVNNFSEVNNELIEELKIRNEELKIVDSGVDELLSDIYQNNEKISMHGKRADAIVKGMLQHSRKSEGKKEPTDINSLCDEYLRLSYHGMRAKDKTFNATLQTNFDSSIGKINVAPQDIGRVIFNLINNAFYAVGERQRAEGMGYEPTVSVSTKKLNDKVEIKVKDNGNGISQNIVDKIFQPFFTTKPTGQGTGLGLSLAYDIIKAHGGDIKVDTKEGQGSEFIIQLQSLK